MVFGDPSNKLIALYYSRVIEREREGHIRSLAAENNAVH